jgi:hypothetical protein
LTSRPKKDQGWRASQQVQCCAAAVALGAAQSRHQRAIPSPSQRWWCVCVVDFGSRYFALPCPFKAAPGQTAKIRPTFFCRFLFWKDFLFPLQRLFLCPPPRRPALKSSQLPARARLRGTWASCHGRIIFMCLFDFVDLAAPKKSPHLPRLFPLPTFAPLGRIKLTQDPLYFPQHRS